MSAILQRHDFRANTMPVPPAWQAAAPRLMAASRSEFLTLGEHAADEAVVVLRTALLVAVNVRIMVKAHAAPRGAAELAGLVGVVGARIADDIKAASGTILRQRIEQVVRKRTAVKPIR